MSVEAAPPARDTGLRTVVHAGWCVPGVAPRILVAVVGVAASLLLVPSAFAPVAAGLAVVAAIAPRTLAAWGTIAIIGLAQLAHPVGASDWRPYATVAVLHLLHVLAALSLVVEPRGRLQARAFRRPLRRWLLVQLPAQAVLAAALLLSPVLCGGVHVDGVAAGILAALAAIAVGLIAVLLFRRR
jgi:hypothetical protein